MSEEYLLPPPTDYGSSDSWGDSSLQDNDLAQFGTDPGPSDSALSDNDLAQFGVSAADLAEGLSVAGIGEWGNSVIRQVANAVNFSPVAEENKGGSPGGGIISSISKFVDQNKALSEMLLKGIGGMASGKAARDTAKTLSQSQLEQLDRKNKHDQENKARISASLMGLKVPGMGSKKAQVPLRRVGGAGVFNSSGRVQ